MRPHHVLYRNQTIRPHDYGVSRLKELSTVLAYIAIRFASIFTHASNPVQEACRLLGVEKGTLLNFYKWRHFM